MDFLGTCVCIPFVMIEVVAVAKMKLSLVCVNSLLLDGGPVAQFGWGHVAQFVWGHVTQFGWGHVAQFVWGHVAQLGWEHGAGRYLHSAGAARLHRTLS